MYVNMCRREWVLSMTLCFKSLVLLCCARIICGYILRYAFSNPPTRPCAQSCCIHPSLSPLLRAHVSHHIATLSSRCTILIPLAPLLIPEMAACLETLPPGSRPVGPPPREPIGRLPCRWLRFLWASGSTLIRPTLELLRERRSKGGLMRVLVHRRRTRSGWSADACLGAFILSYP